MPNYFELSQLIEETGQSKLIFYNRQVNQLEILNLETHLPESAIPLPSEGPNAIRKVYHFYYHNKDSVFIVSDYHLHLVNLAGDFAYSKLINNPNSDLRGLNFQQYFIKVNRDCPIFFNQGFLYVGLKRSDRDKFSFPDFFEGPICAKIDMARFEATLLPVGYPEEMRSHYFGALSEVNLQFMPGQIFYNFKYSPQIYIFDEATQSVKIKAIPSELPANSNQVYTGATGDPGELIQHINQNSEFCGVRPMGDNRFYRFVFIPTQPPGPTRRIGISFFSSDLKLLHETLLPDFHDPNGAFADHGRLMLVYLKEEVEDELHLIPYQLTGR